MHAIALRLESDEAGMAIQLGEGNIFSLPVVQGPLYEKAELTVNRKAGSVRWMPYIRSAATSDTIRRLGDLRLACEVHWAIDKETLHFAMRTAMSSMGGPCNFVSQKGTSAFPHRGASPMQQSASTAKARPCPSAARRSRRRCGSRTGATTACWS